LFEEEACLNTLSKNQLFCQSRSSGSQNYWSSLNQYLPLVCKECDQYSKGIDISILKGEHQIKVANQPSLVIKITSSKKYFKVSFLCGFSKKQEELCSKMT